MFADVALRFLRTFRDLAEAQERPLPYDVDLVDQRSKYGEGLLRRADDQRQRQKSWEGEQSERHQEALRRRQEERRKLEEIEVSMDKKIWAIMTTSLIAIDAKSAISPQGRASAARRRS